MFLNFMNPVLTLVLPLPTNLITARQIFISICWQIVRLAIKMLLLDGLKLGGPGLQYVNVKLCPSLCLGAQHEVILALLRVLKFSQCVRSPPHLASRIFSKAVNSFHLTQNELTTPTSLLWAKVMQLPPTCVNMRRTEECRHAQGVGLNCR
jgi:hypothetical protein